MVQTRSAARAADAEPLATLTQDLPWSRRVTRSRTAAGRATVGGKQPAAIKKLEKDELKRVQGKSKVKKGKKKKGTKKGKGKSKKTPVKEPEGTEGGGNPGEDQGKKEPEKEEGGKEGGENAGRDKGKQKATGSPPRTPAGSPKAPVEPPRILTEDDDPCDFFAREFPLVFKGPGDDLSSPVPTKRALKKQAADAAEEAAKDPVEKKLTKDERNEKARRKREERWLNQSQVLRAMAAVAISIRNEHGAEIALLHDIPTQALQLFDNVGQQGQVAPPTGWQVTAPGEEWHFPWLEGANHHYFIRVRRRIPPTKDSEVIVEVYDSLRDFDPRSSKTERNIAKAINESGWCNTPTGRVTVRPEDIQWAFAAYQTDAHHCGPYTILNSWIHMLGLTPQKLTPNDATMETARDLINAAVQGQVDSAIIHAFLMCYGFVDHESVVQADRTFHRTSLVLHRNAVTDWMYPRAGLIVHRNNPAEQTPGQEAMRHILEQVARVTWPMTDEEARGAFLIFSTYDDDLGRRLVAPQEPPLTRAMQEARIQSVRPQDRLDLLSDQALEEVYEYYRTRIIREVYPDAPEVEDEPDEAAAEAATETAASNDVDEEWKE